MGWTRRNLFNPAHVNVREGAVRVCVHEGRIRGPCFEMPHFAAFLCSQTCSSFECGALLNHVNICVIATVMSQIPNFIARMQTALFLLSIVLSKAGQFCMTASGYALASSHLVHHLFKIRDLHL